MITFANGIRSQVYEALKPIIDFTNQVRSYLPSSDAKRGALSDLTYAGRALLDTVAAGVRDRRLLGAVQTGLTRPRNAIAFDGVLPAPTGSNITINFSPNIYVGGRGENTQNIVEQLQPYARELVELLERSQNRNNRGF
ncbi:MAG: hypothetical protein AAF378_25510 [Cyanobacteria bacterium P01_A01_bin.84]